MIIHQAIKIGLEFPDYYGENWSAFWDCLTDFPNETFIIKIINIEKVLNKFSKSIEIMLRCLKDYKNDINNNVIIKVVYVDGEYELFS